MAKFEESTRASVIQKGVEFEANISEILANILEIDLSKSAALGNSSASLTISSKIQLLKELDYTPKKVANYLTTFIEIRNKFAHVLEISSFTKYFEAKNNGEKNKFLQLATMFDFASLEDQYINCFTSLCFKIQLFLNLTLIATREKNEISKKTVEILSVINSGIDDEKQFEMLKTELSVLIKQLSEHRSLIKQMNNYKDKNWI